MWRILFLAFPLTLLAAGRGEGDLAQWIADQGGHSTRDAAGRLVAIDLTSTWITDADLARIGGLASLRRLNLAHTKIGDAGLEHLAKLPAVEELSLYYAEYVDEDGLAHLKNWSQLRRLDLRGTKVTSKVFPLLAALTNLRSLDLANTQIDDEGFEELSALTKLEDLAIGGNRLTGSCLPLLKAVRPLKHLDVSGMQRVDSGLWGLALTDYNLARLADLTQLESLNLSWANLADRVIDRPGKPEAIRGELRDLSPLVKLKALRELDLTGTPVTPEALAALAQLPALRELRLGLADHIGDAAIEPLLALKQVRVLCVAGTAMTREGVEQLRNRGHFEKLDSGSL